MKIVLTQNDNYPQSLITKYFELSGLGTPYFYDYQKIKITTPMLSQWFHVSKNDLGDKTTDKKLYSDENYFDVEEIPREDPNFVLAVELLKPQEVRVVEIPDGVKWYIHESESGYESIHEEHRTWS